GGLRHPERVRPSRRSRGRRRRLGGCRDGRRRASPPVCGFPARAIRDEHDGTAGLGADPSPMTLSYAVVWHEPPHEPRSGKLELADAALRLVGTAPDGADEITEIPYRLLERTRVATAPGERLCGRPTLVVERRDEEPIAIASVGGIGIVSELVEHISRLLAPEAPGSWALVLLPIRDGKDEQARA